MTCVLSVLVVVLRRGICTLRVVEISFHLQPQGLLTMNSSWERFGLATVVLCTLIIGSATATTFADPIFSGFNIEVYADVTDPRQVTFAPDGTMFVGRDNGGSGGGNEAVKIHRVAPGGGSVTEYGAAAIPDPDPVMFDPTGAISGTPGSVLVGSGQSGGGTIVAILPDESLVTLFGISTTINNPGDLAFDSTGRLLIPDVTPSSRSVAFTTGGAPTNLFVPPSSGDRPIDIAVDSLDRIYTVGSNGSIKQWSSTGTLLDASFSSVSQVFEPTDVGLEFGPGGVWGSDLYAASDGGDIFRIDSSGTATLAGSGFTSINDLEFGPDGALYVPEFSQDRVLRLVAPDSPSNASFDSVSDVDVLNLDFGTVTIDSSPASIPFEITNLLGAGLTADLSLTSISGSGNTGALTTDLAAFSGFSALGGGESTPFNSFFVDTSTPGSFAASYELSFTDTLGTDQTLTLNLNGAVELVDDPSIPDLIYNAATGEVILDPDASAIIGYTLQNDSNGFFPGGFTPILGGVSTGLTSELAEAALSPGAGSIGFVFPAGMNITDLFNFLSVNTVSTGLGAPLVPFDLIVIGSPVPEPSTYVMAAMGLFTLGYFGWRRRRTAG